MNSQLFNPPLNYICVGCLSTDRKLSTISIDEYKKIFTEMFDSMVSMNPELRLCWECSAKLRSITCFKKQVRTAHDCLLRYMVCHTTHVASLSNLTKTNISTTHFYQHNEDDKTTIPIGSDVTATDFAPITANSSNSYFVEIPNIKVVSEDYTSEANGVKNTEDGGAFVKIEDNEFEFGECLYEDENSMSDKAVLTQVKTDNDAIAQETVTNKKKVKSKKKKKRKEDFNASDDEPLKPSEREVDGSETDETDKAVKKRRGKREKPAGVVTNPRVHRNLAQLNVKDGQIEMVVLSWEEVEAERARARDSVVFTRHEYRCGDCVLGFNHRFKLDNHMAKHSASAGPAECPVCHVRCRDDHALVAHKRRHRVRWRCVECGELSSRAGVAADHAARAHGATPTHTCRRCGLTLQSLAKLRNHMKNHGERQKCELCGKTFRDRTSLRTHLFIHSGEKEYSCPHCDKRFLFKKAMEVHLVTHAQPARLYCVECDMTFKNRMSYYQHKKYNLKHIDPAKLKYKCSLCDKKFLKAARLEEHNFAVHLKVTPIRCTMPDCNFACSSRPVLRTHIRMVHRNLRAVRNHVCDTCGKAYTTKKTLEGHMRSHTGERPFHCALCSSTFSYEAALYNHNKLVHLKGKVSKRADWEPTANT